MELVDLIHYYLRDKLMLLLFCKVQKVTNEVLFVNGGLHVGDLFLQLLDMKALLQGNCAGLFR